MAKLQRIHSMTKRSIAMGDTDIERVAVELEAIMSDEHFAGHPALRECMLPGGWLPIASVLNYTPLGRAVWPYGGVGVVGDCLTTRGSLVVELSGDRMCVRSKPLRVQLREQLEFVFSDTNYPKDMHLQLLEDAEGFAKLDVVCSTYTQTRMLLNPVPTDAQRAVLVREAVESSSELIFKPPSKPQDGMGFVRRMTLSEKIRSQVEFYLEQERMASDRFLIEQARDHDGYVPIATILSFPRMRKLVHPQVAAVAHVLSKSAKVEVSADRTLVRPRVAPPESPARASVPTGTARAQVLLVLERLLSDASLTLDRRMQAAIVAHSPADALRSGGSGVRLPVEEVLLHPDVARVLGAAGAMGDGAAELLGQPHPPGSSAGAAAALLRKKLVGLLPQVGESSLLCLSADGAFVERLVPTPEVRQLRSAEPAGVRASGTPAPPSVPPDFSLMTYNLLADMLCTVEQFPEVNVDALDWAHRRPLIEKEIVFHSPDLLCVQELQGTAEGKGEGDHRAELSAALSAHGYEHRYVRKVKRDGSSWPGPQIGNAIFWRSATFEYVEHEEVLIAPLLNGACDDEISRAYFCRGAQVGLVLVLRHRATGRTVVAVTTHLSCNFQEPVTQIAQIHQVLTVAAGVVERHEGAAVVLGADLNSIPGSGCYQLLTAGTLHTAHPHMHIVHSDVRMPSFGDYGGDGDPLYHPLGLQSAYTHLLGARRRRASARPSRRGPAHPGGGAAPPALTCARRSRARPRPAWLPQARSRSSPTSPGRRPTSWARSTTSCTAQIRSSPSACSSCRPRCAVRGAGRGAGGARAPRAGPGPPRRARSAPGPRARGARLRRTRCARRSACRPLASQATTCRCWPSSRCASSARGAPRCRGPSRCTRRWRAPRPRQWTRPHRPTCWSRQSDREKACSSARCASRGWRPTGPAARRALRNSCCRRRRSRLAMEREKARLATAAAAAAPQRQAATTAPVEGGGIRAAAPTGHGASRLKRGATQRQLTGDQARHCRGRGASFRIDRWCARAGLVACCV